MEMKYIIVEVSNFGSKSEHPILFSALVTHKDVYSGMKNYHELISAGFYDVDSKTTYGVSETLKTSSRKEDTDIINNFLDTGMGKLLI